VFDVVADGRLIFSRKAEGGQFPEDDEVLALLRKQAGCT
jgi:hypothetical protein